MSAPQSIRSPFPPDPVIEAYKRDIDRTLLHENLRLSVEERLNNLYALQQFAAEMRRAGERLRGVAPEPPPQKSAPPSAP